MLSVYTIVLVFLFFSLLVPLSMVFCSMLIRRKSESNAVSMLNYESAEESIGRKIGIMNEYLHYFPIFLSFEIIAAILLLFGIVANTLPFSYGITILSLGIFGFVLQVFVVRIAKLKED